jgi:hypothetical protein
LCGPAIGLYGAGNKQQNKNGQVKGNCIDRVLQAPSMSANKFGGAHYALHGAE